MKSSLDILPLPFLRALVRRGIAGRLPAVKELLGEQAGFLRYYSDEILGGPATRLQAMGALYQEAAALQKSAEVWDLSEAVPGFNVLGGAEFPMPSPAYPPAFGIPELRHAVASQIEATHGVRYDADREILITNGASHGIQLALDSFLNPGDAAVLLDPSYLFFAYALEMKRVRTRWVPSHEEDGWVTPDWKALERALSGARLLLLNSPGNPTGGVFSDETLARLVALAEKHDVLVLSDEVYDRFFYEAPVRSPLHFPAARRRTLLVNSFSKRFALASYRVGYVAATEGLLRPLQAQIVARSLPVSLHSQHVALRALRQPEGLLAQERLELRRKRDWMHARLTDLGIRAQPPRGAFFFWIPLPIAALDFARGLLRAERTLVTPGQDFGPSGARQLRLSFVAPQACLDQAMVRFSRYYRRLAT